jgi:hypothetical protein
MQASLILGTNASVKSNLSNMTYISELFELLLLLLFVFDGIGV